MSGQEQNNPFDGPQLQGIHHQRADMTDTNFDGVNLSRARFFAVMSDAKFTDTNLKDADFDDVNLGDARFNNINFSGTKITNANLSNVSISGATLENLDISNANLTGMKINGVLVSDLFDAFEKSKS